MRQAEEKEFPTHDGVRLFYRHWPAAGAKADKAIVLFHRDSDAVKDPIPHVILTVTDMAATAAAVKAAGGTMDGEPRPFGNTGIMIGFAVDPAGNRIELIQQRR